MDPDAQVYGTRIRQCNSTIKRKKCYGNTGFTSKYSKSPEVLNCAVRSFLFTDRSAWQYLSLLAANSPSSCEKLDIVLGKTGKRRKTRKRIKIEREHEKRGKIGSDREKASQNKNCCFNLWPKCRGVEGGGVDNQLRGTNEKSRGVGYKHVRA